MLRITLHKTPDSAQIILEGRLTGPWVTELEQAWQAVKQSGTIPLTVDLTGVGFIADKGKSLLKRMWQEGATLLAHDCCTRHIVGEITGAQPAAAPGRCGTK
jgi:hypothetical protein